MTGRWWVTRDQVKLSSDSFREFAEHLLKESPHSCSPKKEEMERFKIDALVFAKGSQQSNQGKHIPKAFCQQFVVCVKDINSNQAELAYGVWLRVILLHWCCDPAFNPNFGMIVTSLRPTIIQTFCGQIFWWLQIRAKKSHDEIHDPLHVMTSPAPLLPYPYLRNNYYSKNPEKKQGKLKGYQIYRVRVLVVGIGCVHHIQRFLSWCWQSLAF